MIHVLWASDLVRVIGAVFGSAVGPRASGILKRAMRFPKLKYTVSG